MKTITTDSTFYREYLEFCAEFDEIYKDQFQGIKLEQLVTEFMSKRQDQLDSVPFFVPSKFPNQSQIKNLEEDLQIISSDEDNSAPRGEPSLSNKIVGDVYRRAAAAAYLRMTYNKSHLDQEDDRCEPVDLCRYALRHTPDEFEANYCYMITTGWRLYGITGLQERLKVVRVFWTITRRCIKMDPKNPLSHHLLGRYYLEVASLSWLQKTVAESYMGSKMDGTFADAEREFLIAHDLKGEWLPTSLFMAQTLEAQKRPRDEIRRWVDLGLRLECQEPTSELERRQLIEFESKMKQKSSS